MMRYIDRQLKGTKGYIRKQRRFEAVKTVILFAMAFGIFFIGYFTLHTKKSLWSVFAVLALLPACRSLVGVIMLARFDSVSDNLYERIKSAAGSVPVLFENILTTSEKTYFVPVICFISGNLIAYADQTTEVNEKIKKHIEQVLKNAGHKASVKIFDDEGDFTARLRELAEKFSANAGTGEPAVFDTIRAVSL